MKKSQKVSRTAILLAMVLLFQSLRLFLPIPPFFSTFVIGSLVNASLLISAEWLGIGAAVSICLAAPIIAYFQQLLLIPAFIVPVALANSLYVGIFLMLLKKRYWLSVCVAAIFKSAFLYICFSWLVIAFTIPAKAGAAIVFVMSWPQVITGILGGVISYQITKRLQGMLPS